MQAPTQISGELAPRSYREGLDHLLRRELSENAFKPFQGMMGVDERRSWR